MNDLPLRIVKLGGSLLSRSLLVADLRRWLRKEPASRWLFVVGGGPMIDVVAEMQRTHALDDAAAHWLCIRAMQMNAELLAAAMPEGLLVEEFGTPDDSTGRPVFLDPWSWMRNVDPTCEEGPLPESWDVSSDSIAARVAAQAKASELVLLKSALPADPSRLGDYVDRCFARAARRVTSIRFVDLTDPGFCELRYR